MPRRNLRLAKETLHPLGTDGLRSVVGGGSGIDCMFKYTYGPDCWNDITFEQCPDPGTLPLEDCI